LHICVRYRDRDRCRKLVELEPHALSRSGGAAGPAQKFPAPPGPSLPPAGSVQERG
jgi:hypothetical protein